MEEIKNYWKNIDKVLKTMKSLYITGKTYNQPEEQISYTTSIKRYYDRNSDEIIKKSLIYYKQNRLERMEKMKEYNKLYYQSRKKGKTKYNNNKKKIKSYKETKPKEIIKKLEEIEIKPVKVAFSKNNLLVEF